MNSNLNRALEWTAPDVQPAILGILSCLALVVFSAAMWPKLKILINAMFIFVLALIYNIFFDFF